MPVFSRLISIVLRVGEIGFAAVVAGIIGSYLRAFSESGSWPKSRWIYTEVIAGISIVLGLIWLIPFAWSFNLWPLDLIISLAWFAAFGLLVDSLNGRDCGSIWAWRNFTDGDVCGRWKAAEAFAFLSAVFWMVSTIVGIWFTFRTRNRRAVAGDSVRPRRRRHWFGGSHV